MKDYLFLFNVPVYTAHISPLSGRRGGPLLEASLVNVVATAFLAPDKSFLWLEFHEANWAITLNGFLVAVMGPNTRIILRLFQRGPFVNLANFLKRVSK